MVGGPGSGNSWQFGRQTVEASRAVDIRQLKQNGMLHPGYSGIFSWSIGEERTGSVELAVSESCLILSYRIRTYDEDWENIEQRIQFTWTPCYFGGERPWFLCTPCGTRVGILYGVGRYFTCRHCNDLVYQSQREDSGQRCLRKARRLIRKLGGDPDDDYYPPKPKGMHLKTYNRLIQQIEWYESHGWEGWELLVAKALGKGA